MSVVNIFEAAAETEDKKMYEEFFAKLIRERLKEKQAEDNEKEKGAKE